MPDQPQALRQRTWSLENETPPQDPLLPQHFPITGPTFIDTGGCMCQLRAGPGPELAWRCVGNQTEATVQEISGKWFKTEFPRTEVDRLTRPLDDDSTPPQTETFHRYGGQQDGLIEGDEGLDVWDVACTAENHTSFSTSWYRAAAQIERGERPVDAAPCWRPDTIPVQIQTVEDWLEYGCTPGFLCKNNTVNSLPQFCPPITQCQISRLFGVACASPFVKGENFAMGPFEPVVCPSGRYCPSELQGKEMLVCPAGTYCQPGSAAPTPCSIGSKCPAGSTFELFIIPAVALLALDLIIIALIVAFALRGRRRSEQQSRSDNRMSASSSLYSMDAKSEQWDDDVPLGREGGTRAFIDSMRRATAAATHVGLSFGYTRLTYQPRGASRPILQNITGSISRGSLTVVMGGSGAGKSTFINVLMGKLEHTTGSVSVNDAPGRVGRYKKLVGYVPQDDVVSPELTVRENILHSARMRLPRAWTSAEIHAHVDAVVECLELSHVRDSIVGTIGKPIISGGQRKRVSIGMELAAAPMAIFLDEPTSGLDATAASSIMRTLRALSGLGITVIATIHQPRREIFAMIDDLILLASGELLYQGPGASARAFFEAQGFRFPRHANDGDVLTDIITGNGRPYKSRGDISQHSLIGRWTGHSESSPPTMTPPSTSRGSTRRKKDSGIPRSLLRKRHAPFLRQLQHNLSRAFVQQYRTKATLLYELGLATLAGFLLGLAESPKKGVLFTGLYSGPYEVLSVSSDFQSAPEMALLTAIAIGLVSAAPGVKVFSEELLLHRREAEAGHSRLAYFLAKSIAVAPRMTMACLHFTTPLLLMAVPVIPWSLAFLANLMYFYCIYGLASGVSMVVRREDAPLFATMFALVVGILSGAAPPMRSVVEWNLEWLWRASPGVWLAEYYFGHLVAPFSGIYNVKLAADLVGFHLDWRWRNLGVLAAIGTAYRVLAFAGLLFGKRLRT
ncbi:hypothetical protein QBC34DRAFT_37781 [Podospora aff. communis PSN243]|uniref:ABC transporter domain-containing protein n=1 Tax=Podospora aff. communis PSN243 TaxID=3040156 RepID=A0AAV9FX67_9PEZI|nr:hypothetical protein QBC34DRAFT_37781 [Podospora aff. communis PSN243]